MIFTKQELQIQREASSHNAGIEKFEKNEAANKRGNNGSATTFGLMVKKHLLGQVIVDLEKKISQTVGQNQKSISQALQKLVGNGVTETLFNVEEAAFLGIQLTLSTALNPNIIQGKEIGRSGGDKKLVVKKTATELQAKIGDVIHKQMSLKLIQKTFPDFFHKANSKARQPIEDGARASTAYWEQNIFRAIRQYKEKLMEQGDLNAVAVIDRSNFWSYQDKMTIGSLVLSCVLNACSNYLTLVDGTRNGKKSKEVVLTTEGKMTEAQMREFVAEYSHDLLPMLIEPVPVTNDNLGGWLTDSLNKPDVNRNGSIVLSDKHLEFINRQAKVPFQINPFTQALMEELCEREWGLGKFHFQRMEEPVQIAQQLGYGSLDKEEQDKAVRSDPRTKGLRRRNTAIHARNTKKVKDGLIAFHIQQKATKLLDDECFYIPMKYCMRGRIYSRVPFISFQSNDAGRYLIRFAEQTPVDDRTEHWIKIGISNAGGNDKLCWDKRLLWFDKNREEIINVGRMIDGGDFKRAYEFLTDDCVEDPFALAALANEYVKVFVDKTQNYTQCYVCVDASCSGTSIFNAWRRNLSGATKTNLVDTAKPADIYTEVWEEIKRLAPDGTFDPAHIKRLEKLKLARKMCKTVYVPAQYASPISEQKANLKRFNNKLKKLKLEFSPDALKVLQNLWAEALDEVSSINTVISWFKARTKEALETNDTITYTTCNGSVMTLSYPKTKYERVQVFGYGSALFRQQQVGKASDEVDQRKLMNAVTANVTHATDAAALCEALWDWSQSPFVAIHDACGVPPGRHLDEALTRLKEGLVTATQYNVWDTFRDDNGLPKDPITAPPVVGDLKDWDLVRKSNYLYA